RLHLAAGAEGGVEGAVGVEPRQCDRAVHRVRGTDPGQDELPVGQPGQAGGPIAPAEIDGDLPGDLPLVLLLRAESGVEGAVQGACGVRPAPGQVASRIPRGQVLAPGPRLYGDVHDPLRAPGEVDGCQAAAAEGGVGGSVRVVAGDGEVAACPEAAADQVVSPP